MPAPIVKTFASKTGLSIEEVESKWNKAKNTVKKKIDEKDERFYPTVVSVLKKMLGLNESIVNEEGEGGGASAMTTTSDIATVPKRLGEKPIAREGMYDGNLNGFPYFEIKKIDDFLKLKSSKAMNKKLAISDARIHQHLKTNGSPFLVKHKDWTIKLTKKDF